MPPKFDTEIGELFYIKFSHTSIAFFNCLSLKAERALRLLSTDSGTAGSLFGALQKYI